MSLFVVIIFSAVLFGASATLSPAWRTAQPRIALSEGALAPLVLAYAFEDGDALLTHAEPITGHIAARHREDKGHAGVFIAGKHLQGEHGIGTIVTSILEYHALIVASAWTVQEDVDNHVKYI